MDDVRRDAELLLARPDAGRPPTIRRVAAAWLAGSDRLHRLIDAYLAMGKEAERRGCDRRAAAYRSVANMLGVLVQAGEPIAVDFLARYTEDMA